jgi:hypothetical protein
MRRARLPLTALEARRGYRIELGPDHVVGHQFSDGDTRS